MEVHILLNAIVAVYSDWGIGYNGAQPIVIPDDRRFFREITDGGVVIVGRKTFEGIGKPLPNRRNIVLTSDRAYRAADVFVAHSTDDVIAEVSGFDPDKVFVIGGGRVYDLLLPMCDFAYVTKIDSAPLSDTFFPDLDVLPGWVLVDSSETFESNGTRYTFCLYRGDVHV